MKGVNKCIFIGTLGRDPETKTFQSGGSICSFSIAVNESWKDKNTGEKKEHVEWINIEANGKLADVCSNYLKKGSKVYVEGKQKTRKWQAQDGTDRYSTYIIASEMQMLDSRNEGSAQPVINAQQERQQRNYDDFNSDVPF